MATLYSQELKGVLRTPQIHITFWLIFAKGLRPPRIWLEHVVPLLINNVMAQG